jgi:hypothetical protein
MNGDPLGPVGPPPDDGGSFDGDDPGAIRGGLLSLAVLLAAAGLVWLLIGGHRVPW